MPSVSDLIHSSFRLIGAIAAGETLETNELNDAFISFNQMIASWNTEGPSVVGRKWESVPTNLNTNVISLPTRPIHIESASVNCQGIDCPLELVDSAGWEAITEKGQTAIIARKLFCDYLYPQSTCWLWPVPRMPGVLELWMYSPIPAFVTVNDTIDLAPGYEAALRYNFAVDLLPEYPRSQADPSLPALAQQFKASLMQLNAMHHLRSQAQAPAQAVLAQAPVVGANG